MPMTSKSLQANPTSLLYHLDQLSFYLMPPVATGRLKTQPQDFQVREQMAYELSGEGEHLWCWVEKQGENTDWVAKQLAKAVGIRPSQVGYAGKKDRHAVTWQWFSLHLPGKLTPNLTQQFSDFASAEQGFRVLAQMRHQRKLQTGGLQGNQFQIVLRDLTADKADIEARLRRLANGFPNYFAQQRFGQNYANLAQATRYFHRQLKHVPPWKKGIYLSAVRAWIFNDILSERLAQANWQTVVSGDVYQLQGSKRTFHAATEMPDVLAVRLDSGDIHSTGLLTGQGDTLASDEVKQLEEGMVARHPIWQSGLIKAGLRSDRRALRAVPQDLSWQWLESNVLQLNFALPAGSYATALLRELIVLKEMAPEEVL